MKFKKGLIFICLIICLFSIASVCAGDVNETAIANDNTDQVIEEVNDGAISEIDDAVISSSQDEIIKETDDGTFTALQNKIRNADINATIVLENDYTYDKGFSTKGIRINNGLTIDGNGKTINAAGKSCIFDIWNCNVTIKNLKIINAHIPWDDYGGAICNHGETLTLTNVEFINNTANKYGGAIYNSQGTLALTDVEFINNSAEYGGAIYNFNGNLTAINTQFINNVAKYGGAIDSGHYIFIDGCKFINNTCTAAGGIVDTSRNSTIKNTIFANNTGGAIGAYGFNLITNCTFVNNTGDFYRCAIQNSGDVIISKTIFANNTGGAIYNTANLIVTESTFTNNTRIGYNSYGGAIYAEYSNNMTIKDTQFNCNAALGNDYYSGRGGAIFAKDVSNVNIINAVFNNNIASGTSSAGGAIWIAGDNLNIENNTFTNNSADQGAAVYLSTVTSKEVVGKEWVEGHNVTNHNVIVYDYVGGVLVGSHHPTYWVEGYYTNIYGDVLVGNDIKINKNIFKSNTAKDSGYAIVDHGTNTRISNNINDKISIYSSTIYVNSTNTTITNNNFAGKVSTINVTGGGVDNSKVSATFFNSDGSPLANAQVTFKIGDKTYAATTNSKGVATADVDLVAGSYIGTAINPVNNEQKQFKLVIDKANSAIALASNQINEVTILTATLTPATATGNVVFNINGEDKSAPIKNGKATLTLSDLKPGDYSVTASYNGDKNLNSSTSSAITFNVAKVYPILTAENLTKTYGAADNFAVNLIDSRGNAIANALVNVNIKDKVTPITTGSDGQATMPISLAPATYTATVTYGSDAQTTAKIIVKKATPKLTAKAKTFKKSVKTKKYAVTLKNNLNKVMKNKKVTIKVNKKTYSAKTNSKGKATFKITKLTKKGKYNAVVAYKGDKYYNKVIKKVKITVK